MIEQKDPNGEQHTNGWKWKERGREAREMAAHLSAVRYWSGLLWGQHGCRMIRPVVTQPFTAVTQHQASLTHTLRYGSRVEVCICWWVSEGWYSSLWCDSAEQISLQSQHVTDWTCRSWESAQANPIAKSVCAC